MTAVYVGLAVLAVLLLIGAATSIRILKQNERGVQFRLGRVKDGARGPGLIFVVPLVDRVHRVSLRIVTMPIQSQGIITRDKVSVVELKDIQLPESMKRAMARQAEAEREKRAKIIAAQGEALAAGELGQ